VYIAKDSLFFDGLEGNLGSNLKKYAATIVPVTRKEKYFH
jgi:hypothetical protein